MIIDHCFSVYLTATPFRRGGGGGGEGAGAKGTRKEGVVESNSTCLLINCQVRWVRAEDRVAKAV